MAALFVLVAGFYGSGVFSRLSSGGFENHASESYKAQQVIQHTLPATETSLIVLLKDKHGAAADTLAFRMEALKIFKALQADQTVSHISSYYSTNAPSFLSRDHKATFAIISLKGDASSQSDAVTKLRSKIASSQLEVKLGGTAAINNEITSTVAKDLAKAESISFTLLAILLVIVFRSFVAALLPLVLGAIAVLGAFLVTRLLTNVTEISEYAINVIILLGLGLAVDYSLFIVSRFREELRSGAAVSDALSTTMQTAGRTVLFSGTTVILSLLSLLIFPLNFLQSMGLGGAAAVVVAMIAALVVLPAILVRLGERVNALSFGSVAREHQAQVRGQATPTERQSLWYRLSRGVMHRPVAVLVTILALLLIAGIPFLHVRFGSADYRSLPAGSEARVTSETLRDEFDSPESPITVVFQAKSNLAEPASVGNLHNYTQTLQALPGVQKVATAAGASSNTAVINVDYKSDPLSPTTQQLVRRIRQSAVPAGASVLVGGQPAILTDLLDTLGRSLPYAAAFIIIALFVLLFLMLGSFVIPLQAIMLNILSLTASFGALVWVFQDGNLSNLLHFTSDGTINATQPILIFAIAFGLSMDYAVFLLSRIKEQYDLSGDTREAIATGIQKTGPIITSAAVLLCVVVAAFATSSIPLIQQIGVGLSLAILIDAFVIRMLLVPAVMRLLGKKNWWAPRRLQALAARLGLAEKNL